MKTLGTMIDEIGDDMKWFIDTSWEMLDELTTTAEDRKLQDYWKAHSYGYGDAHDFAYGDWDKVAFRYDHPNFSTMERAGYLAGLEEGLKSVHANMTFDASEFCP